MSANLQDSSVRVPSAMLRQAMAEDSNLEMDWLWFAEQVSSEAERRYCLERALYINPKSQMAQRGLESLKAARPSKASAFSLTHLFQSWTRAGQVRRTSNQEAW